MPGFFIFKFVLLCALQHSEFLRGRIFTSAMRWPGNSPITASAVANANAGRSG
jgi:hypothetical protein